MAYFSNGTEGDMYEAQWCDRCVHGQDDTNPCRVMLVHALWNYDQFPEHKRTEREAGKAEATKAILETLIPTEDGYAADCPMFIEDKRVAFERQAVGALPGLEVAG